MKRHILIVGLAGDFGGIENIMLSIYRYLDREKYVIDFMTFDSNCVWEDDVLNSGGEVYHITRRGINPILHYKELRNFFKRNKGRYDFIWCNTSSASDYSIHKYIRRYTNSKIITHSHCTFFESKNKITQFLHLIMHYFNKNKMARNTDIYFACSKAAGLWLFGEKYLEKLHIIKNGVNVNRFMINSNIRDEIRTRLKLNNKIVVGNVGRLSYQKNHTFMLKVFYELCKLNENAMLLLVGDGEERRNIEKKIMELGIRDRVIITGHTDKPEEFIQAMDVFLFPSLFEGLGISLVEAQISGLPCLVSDKIPDEAIITQNVIKYPLTYSAKKWATCILDLSEISRVDLSEDIKSAGYDIVETVNYVSNKLGR